MKKMHKKNQLPEKSFETIIERIMQKPSSPTMRETRELLDEIFRISLSPAAIANRKPLDAADLEKEKEVSDKMRRMVRSYHAQGLKFIIVKLLGPDDLD